MRLFVSYFYTTKTGNGVGNSTLETPLKVMDEAAIRKIEQALLEKNGYKQLVMLNYKVIRK